MADDDDLPSTAQTLDARDSQATTDPTMRLRLRSPSAPMSSEPRYRMGDRIARGGMGEVIAAHDTQIGRDVAIKRLRADEPTANALARFLREARIQGRLDHPAIVPVHELAYDPSGRPFFAMRKLSGTTLGEILRKGSATRPRLLRAFADVCLAIEFAHTRGIVHRDIKPPNIVLGDFNEVYVLDWGVARVLGASEIAAEIEDPRPSEQQLETAAGAMLGTPGYMSPEQVRGEPVDGRADVYALGCILYEILAGAPLPPRGSDGAASALAGVDARPSLRDRDVPPELDALCVAATATTADRRPTARELGEAIERYLDGDRDLALRQRLAADHLAAARAAVAGSLDTRLEEDQRRTAMREAGRALALDPRLHGAAELVGRLMLEPPLVTPTAVVAELAAIDSDAGRRQAWIGLSVHAFYLVLAGLLWVLGLRDPRYTGGFAAASAVNLGFAWIATRTRPTVFMFVVVAGNLVTLALMARMFSPFLIAPGVTAVTVMAIAFYPSTIIHSRVFAGIVAVGVAIPIGAWALEATHVVGETFFVEGGILILASPAEGIGHVPVAAVLCLYVVTLIGIAAVIGHHYARTARAARDHLHVQAWQLRQLLSVGQ